MSSNSNGNSTFELRDISGCGRMVLEWEGLNETFPNHGRATPHYTIRLKFQDKINVSASLVKDFRETLL